MSLHNLFRICLIVLKFCAEYDVYTIVFSTQLQTGWQLAWVSSIVLSWWRHQKEIFSALLAICAGNSSVPGEVPHKGQWRGALMFSLIWIWINGWVNNREADDLRHHDAHYNVSVMLFSAIAVSLIIPKPTIVSLLTLKPTKFDINRALWMSC